MRLTLDLPEELLERARRMTSLRTIRETIVAGLEELIRKSKREELRRSPGRISLRVDVPRSRERRRA